MPSNQRNGRSLHGPLEELAAQASEWGPDEASHRSTGCSPRPANFATASGKDLTVSTLREHWDRIRLAFIVGILVNLLARGQALFGSLYSIDGYFVAKKSFNDEIAYNLGDGRFLRALLWRLQELLGFSPLASESASLALATVALVAAAILFGDAIFGKHARDKTMFLVVLLTLHPFITEYFYYGEVAFGIALSVLLAALAVRLTAPGLPLRTSIIASATAVVAALATYQVAIGFIVAGFILASVMEASAEAGPTLRRQIGVRTASFVLGTGAYGLCLLVLRLMHPAVQAGRAFSPGGAGLGGRLEGLWSAILQALAPPDGIVTTPVAAISGNSRGRRRRRHRHRHRHRATIRALCGHRGLCACGMRTRGCLRSRRSRKNTLARPQTVVRIQPCLRDLGGRMPSRATVLAASGLDGLRGNPGSRLCRRRCSRSCSTSGA